MRITLAPISSSRRLCRVALLTAAVVLFATRAQAGENAAATIIVPDGGRVVQQGERVDIYDAKSNRTAYGIQRGDGSMDVFNTDGSRRGTIQQRPGGGVRVTAPGKP